MTDGNHMLATTQPHRRCARRGLTLTELLVVIIIIVVLLTLLVVAMNRALLTGQSANTQFLMGSINKALVAFRGDHGYLPPILDDDRNLFNLNDPSDANERQDWYSITSVVEYLIGPDWRAFDGYGSDPGAPGDTSERPPTGIRTPGADGVWNATYGGAMTGALNDRNPLNEGRHYAPYLELNDSQQLAAIDASGNVLFAKDVLPARFNSLPKVLVDYWGQPIRYYRRPYPLGAIGQSYRVGSFDPLPTLSDVYVLRPFDLPRGTGINGINDATGDPTTTQALNAAEFALLSFGADRTINPDMRFDDLDATANTLQTDEANGDNIVEIGQ